MQNAAEIEMYPGLDLSDVGLSPTGLPLYRVVKAETRLEKMYDSEGTFREIPAYLVDGWILEKYLTSVEYAGTPEQFQAACDEYGYKKRYPTEGEYDCVCRFESGDEVQLAREYARYNRHGIETFTPEERKRLRDERQKYQAAERKRIRRDIIADAAVSRFGRSAEKIKFYGPNGNEIYV